MVLVGGAAAAAGGRVASGSTARRGPSKPQRRPRADAQLPTDQAAGRCAAAQVQLAAAVTVSPPTGTTGVALDAAVTVSTRRARLTSVQVTDAAGAAVPGTLGRRPAWRGGPSAPLQPAATYQVVATVAAPTASRAQQATTFTTLTPTALVTAIGLARRTA